MAPKAAPKAVAAPSDPEVIQQKMNKVAMEEGMGHASAACDGADVTDDLDLFPMNLLRPLMMKLASCCFGRLLAKAAAAVTKCPGSALLHLLAIEMAPVYFFYYTVYNQMKALAGGIKQVLLKDVLLPTGTKNSHVDACLKLFATKLVWATHEVNVKSCVSWKASTTVLTYTHAAKIETKFLTIPAVNYGALLLSCLFVILCATMFSLRCGFAWTSSSTKYLRFLYTLRRSRAYRYLSGFFMFMAVFALVVMITASIFGSIIAWFISTQMSSIVMTIISMKMFTRPTKPKFDYMKEEFNDVGFKRGFFESGSGFATKLSATLIQCSRGFPVPLQDLLVNPEEWQNVEKILMDGSSLQTELRAVVPAPDAAAELKTKMAAIGKLKAAGA